MKRNIITKIAWIFLSVTLVFFLFGCASDDRVPDVTHLNGDFQMVRTEHVLFDLDTLMTEAEAQKVFSDNAIFWDLYFNQVMAIPGDSERNWRTLASDPYLRAIADTVDAAFTDMSDIQSQFRSAFQYLQYYFPGNRPPNVYTLISGFGYFPFIFEDGPRDGLGISLEMFLGADFPYHSFTAADPAFSDFMVRTYNADHLVKRAMDVVVDDLTGPPTGNSLLDLMLHNGKKLYILEHLLSTTADTILFEFTPEQLLWCGENEKNLWAHFLKDDLLYATEFRKVQKLIAPAPAIPGMPSEAPGGVANWTGWKIMHALVRRHPELKLTDLIAMHDAQAILEEARYRPQ